MGESLQSATVNTGDPIPNSYVTQYSADFTVTAEQNGYQKGDLVDVYVLSEDGAVVGVYSNGKSLPLYRVAVAVFSDPEELIKKRFQPLHFYIHAYHNDPWRCRKDKVWHA